MSREGAHGAQQQAQACAAAGSASTAHQGALSRAASRCGAHHHQHGARSPSPQQAGSGQAAPAPPPPQRHEQFRAPPARYASTTSNLGGLPRAGGGHPHHQHPPQRGGPTKGYPHHHHHHHALHHDEATCTCVLPRTSVLCRLLVAMTVLLVFVQAVSCGMFFCVRLPVSHHRPPFADYRDLVTDLSAPSMAALNDAKQEAAQEPPPAALAGQQRGAGTAAAAGQQQQQQQHGQQQQQQQQQQGQPLAAVPKLIPRVVHQTYRSRHLPAPARAYTRSWATLNGPAWQVRFYSDDAALSFVQREFPEYFEAYLSLPKDVERADFFRYMVVLRLGGVYADVDAECRQPLDGVIQPADTLLVGWDAEAPDGAAGAGAGGGAGLARQRLVANWFFAAAPGHPVLRELCDVVARNAMSTFSRNGVRDTAERTGQGVWTDLVLKHALQHRPAKHDDPWRVRILPRVAFGARPTGGSGSSSGSSAELPPDTPGVVVLHHFMASWQEQRHRKVLQVLAPLLMWRRPASPGASAEEPQRAAAVAASNATHFPVSVSFTPQFTMMTDLVGRGDEQAADDVSAAITAHGTWQPALAPHRRPAVVEALAGALAKHSRQAANSPGGATAAAADAAATTGEQGAASDAAAQASGAAAGSSSSGDAGAAASIAASPPGPLQGGVLVDVGAGHGFFSLAAAARGHRVVAFEASPRSLAAFGASIAYNGFEGLISLHSTALGAVPEEVCLEYDAARPGCPGDGDGAAANAAAERGRPRARNATAAASGGGPRQQAGRRLLPDARAANASGNGSSSGSGTEAAEAQRRRRQRDAALRRRRGYPWLSDGPALRPDGPCCRAGGSRVRLSDALANVSDVAALRVSAHGHEGWVLEGAADYLRGARSKPEVVYVEFWPAAMRAAGYAQPAALLRQLFDLGYTDIAHAGRVCDRRWREATHELHLQGSWSPAARMALQQPTWCKLRPEQFGMLADTADAGVPENVLFLLGQSHGPQQQQQQQHAGTGQGSSSGGGQSSSSSSTTSTSSRGSRSGSVAGSGSSSEESSGGSRSSDAVVGGEAAAAGGLRQHSQAEAASEQAASAQLPRTAQPDAAISSSSSSSSSRQQPSDLQGQP